MSFLVVKITLTTLLIVGISELARRSSLVAAILASVPLVSVLAMVWLYVDTRDVVRVSALATGIFWLVLPSLALFLSLPLLLKQGFNFYLSMIVSIGLTAACYWLMITLLQKFGIKL